MRNEVTSQVTGPTGERFRISFPGKTAARPGGIRLPLRNRAEGKRQGACERAQSAAHSNRQGSTVDGSIHSRYGLIIILDFCVQIGTEARISAQRDDWIRLSETAVVIEGRFITSTLCCCAPIARINFPISYFSPSKSYPQTQQEPCPTCTRISQPCLSSISICRNNAMRST